MPRNSFHDRLTRRMKARGMKVEGLLDAAREFDRDGYSESTLHSMYKGRREFQLRAMAAMIQGVGATTDEFPEYRLALIRYFLDDRVHGTDEAMANLELLASGHRFSLSMSEVKAIPIQGRTDSIRDGEQKGRKVQKRRGANPKRPNRDG